MRRRASAATSYLKPAMKRPNLTVATDAQAERILFEGRTATGVRFRSTSDTEVVLRLYERYGDDFVVKPIDRTKLLTRIVRGLTRAPKSRAG